MSHGNNIYTVWHPELEKNIKKLAISAIYIFIIQQIVTMPIYGKEALNICHPTRQISCDIRK